MKKRLLMFVLVFILACSVSFADEIDISNLDLKELEALQSTVSARIVELKAADGIDENLIYEGKGVKVYTQGKPTLMHEGSVFVDVQFVIKNDTDKTLTFASRGLGVNDYSIYGHDYGDVLVYDLQAGMKYVATVTFSLEQFNGKSADDVESVKFWVDGFDKDYNSFVESDYVEAVYK